MHMIENKPEVLLAPGFTNTWIIISGSEMAVIDPYEISLVSEKAQESGLKLVWSAATHGHFDHTLGAREISDMFGSPFYLHDEDIRRIHGKPFSKSTALTRISGDPSCDADFFELADDERPECLSLPDYLKVGEVEVKAM